MMKNFTYSIFIFITVFFSSALGVVEVLYAQVGETVTLNIPENQGNMNKYVHWDFGKPDGFNLGWRNPMGGSSITKDEPWKDMVTLLENKLIITGIKEGNFGLFYCKVNNKIHSFRIIRVTMKTPSPLLPGEHLSLSCSADSPRDVTKPKIYWMNPLKNENSKETVSRMAKSQDNGDWFCVVENGNYKKQFKVHVMVVDLSPSPTYTYTSASSPLKIPCSIPPKISWEIIKTKGMTKIQWEFTPKSSTTNQPQQLFYLSSAEPLRWSIDTHTDLKPAPDPKKDLSLTKGKGEEEDSGVYECIMKFNTSIDLSSNVTVRFLKITSFPGTDLISGQSVILTCTLGYPLLPNMQVRWTPPEASSLSPSECISDSVTISEVDRRDGGNWRCELLQNQTLLTSAEIKLKIERKLSIWMMVIISSATVIMILLLILVFILCRRRRRKMRHMRQRLCQCKNPKPKGFYRS